MTEGEALTIFLNHQPLIRAYAFAICRDYQMVEDVAQEVALLLVSRSDRPAEGSGLVRWLKGVVRNQTLKALQRQRRLVPLSHAAIEALGESYADPPADDLARRCEAVARCMESVRGTTRSVLEEHYGRGRSPRDLARRLDRTVGAVYSILKRGRAILAECVRRRLGEGSSA